jgi:4,5-dihydroxyphthalate decarboxylase
MMSASQVTTLSAAFDDYPHTQALKSGGVKSDQAGFAFSTIKPANKFFKPCVRELKFDVSELAIGTFLMAKAWGKPLVLLPATVMGRFQHGTLLYNAARGTMTPQDLPGKRVGVRAYSQTTGIWVRGILFNDYGVDTSACRWVTQEDGHVAEFEEPPGVERAAEGKDLIAMLRAGEIDAAIYGVNLPNDPALKSVIPDPEAAAAKWYAQHRVVPINHMVVVTERLAKTRPDLVREVYRVLLESKRAAGLPKPGTIDVLPFGLEACRPALVTLIKYLAQQKLIPRALTVEELFDDTTRVLAG